MAHPARLRSCGASARRKHLRTITPKRREEAELGLDRRVGGWCALQDLNLRPPGS